MIAIAQEVQAVQLIFCCLQKLSELVRPYKVHQLTSEAHYPSKISTRIRRRSLPSVIRKDSIPRNKLNVALLNWIQYFLSIFQSVHTVYRSIFGCWWSFKDKSIRRWAQMNCSTEKSSRKTRIPITLSASCLIPGLTTIDAINAIASSIFRAFLTVGLHRTPFSWLLLWLAQRVKLSRKGIVGILFHWSMNVHSLHNTFNRQY